MPSNKHTHAENIKWHNHLPAKRLSASVLCWNDDGTLLFVLPSYESWWTLPGGVVEADESPREAAARELQEETGLSVSAKDLQFVGVNYAHRYKEWDDFVHFYFNAGTLSSKAVQSLGKRSEKLHGCQFLAADQLPTFIAPYRLKTIQELFEKPQMHGFYHETKLD